MCRLMPGAIAPLLMIVFASNSVAATIETVDTAKTRAVATISGRIVPGDAKAFDRKIVEANGHGKIITTVKLNSVGGNISEAQEIAKRLSVAEIATHVEEDAVCASACFLMFAAGAKKYAHPSARIGIHGASINGEEGLLADAATVHMARFLKEFGVPPSIIGRMVITPPSEMVWLTPGDLRSMNVASSAETPRSPPAQTSDRPAAPGSPPRISSVNLKGWTRLKERALKLSAIQNGGKPRIDNKCSPRTNRCGELIFYERGHLHFEYLMTITDRNNTIIKRTQTQTFHGNIRIITDWHTGKVTREVRGNDGKWFKVKG